MLSKILSIIGIIMLPILFAVLWKVRYHRIKEEEEGQE